MDRERIEVQIGRILNSRGFADKSQLRKLLAILSKYMESQAALKPDRVIAELWPEEAKTKGSSDLATEKNRLRRALQIYYSSEGKNDVIVISLPNRSMPGPDGLREKRWVVAEERRVFAGPPAEPIAAAPRLEVIAPAAKATPRRGLAIAGALVALAVLSFSAYRAVGLLRAPQAGRLDGTVLTIMDGDGRELWHKTFPEGFWEDYYAQGLAMRMWFGDLDGDARGDVLFLYHPAVNPKSHSTTLICYSGWGKEKWRWTPGRTLPELDGSPATFKTVGLAVLNATAAHPRRIVVSSYHDEYYPHQIAILDGAGKAVSEYWHSGHLDHLALDDLNGDGSQQIVATGIANGYHQATLIVLEPDEAGGASIETARPELQLHGLGVAHERLRLLFPRSDLNEALAVYNVGQEITVDRGAVRFSVLECGLVPRCVIWYEFGNGFKLRSATADDQFRSAHKEFYLKSKDDHPFSAAEEAAFQKVRCLSGCAGEFLAMAGQ